MTLPECAIHESPGSALFVRPNLTFVDSVHSKYTMNQLYSKTCRKRPLKNRQNKGIDDKLSKVLQNAPREHFAILLTCIKR